MPVSGDGGHLRDDAPQARTSVVTSKLYPKRGLATDSAPGEGNSKPWNCLSKNSIFVIHARPLDR